MSHASKSDAEPPKTPAEVIDRIVAWGRLHPCTPAYKRCMLYVDAHLMSRKDTPTMSIRAQMIEDMYYLELAEETRLYDVEDDGL